MIETKNNSLDETVKSLRYWQQQLAGSLPLLDLPTDKPRQSSIEATTQTQYLSLSGQLLETLTAFCQDRDVDLFIVLLTTFKVLMYRYAVSPVTATETSQDISIGSPIIKRAATHEQFDRDSPGERLSQRVDRPIGNYLDYIVFRTDLSGNPTFIELLERVQSVVTAAYIHQDLSFDRLLADLQIERSSSYHPLFQVMFMLDRDDTRTSSTLDPAIVPISLDTPTNGLDLALKLTATATEITGYFEYAPELFLPATIARIAINFQELLSSILIDPAQSIDRLSIVAAAERSQLLVAWNQTERDYPHQCIHQLFEAQVARTPDAIAVVFEDRHLTYRELNDRANQLAHYLRTLGVGANILVGLYVDRSLDLVVGIWGILKAGGAYVPLDPAYPQDRIGYILADSDAKVLIVDEHLLAALPPHQAEIVSFATHKAQLDRQPRSNPLTEPQLDRLAYIIYTSGSTGNPKGVKVCHRSQANLLAHLQHSPGLTSADTLLAVTTICFDTSTVDIYLPLIVGAKIVLVSSEVAADGFQLLAKLTDSGATFLQATPASFRLLLAAGWQGSPNLRVVSTGEALSRNLANLLLEKVAQLWDLYGPTETTVWSTGSNITDLRQISNFEGALEPIGKPIANTQAYILDRYLQPVPIGVRGELHIGGDCLAVGYHNLPDLTAAKFIANPFSDNPNSRLYKTGDLARYLPDGNIEYIGRIDHQVKIRGFRIELGEIEGLLAKYPGVKEVAVIVRADIAEDPRLIAYIVLDPSPEVAIFQKIGSANDSAASQPESIGMVDRVASALANRLREFLAAKLPHYMVPAAFVFLAALPLTPNGKIDRRALPAHNYVHQREDTFVAAQDELELQLTNMWEQVLGIEQIGVRDNFFALGGYSLLAVRLIAEVDRVWHQKLPLATFLSAPTIAEFASVLRQGQRSKTWSSLVPIDPSGSKPPLFCIHPVGGNILEYYPLSAHLDPEQPLYGLQSIGLDGEQTPLSRIEDMAACYIQEMQSIQPDGPYFLIGYSFGGLVAFEIARQLESQGHQIGLLAFIDNQSPNLPVTRPPFLTAVGIHLRNLQQLDIPDGIKYIKDRIQRWTIYRNNENREKQFLLDNWTEPLPPEYLQVLEANFQAGKNYQGKFYPGKITLFRSSVQPVGQALYPDLGWGELAGDVEVYDLPGHHNSLLKEPYIQVLAQKLKLCLEQSSCV